MDLICIFVTLATHGFIETFILLWVHEAQYAI
jgi:hypothetical protein